MKVEFSTRSYVLSHGREPSRTVLGCWAFEFEDSAEAWFAPSTLTLGEAKKAAKAEVERRAAAAGPVAQIPHWYTTTVKVLP